MADLRMFTAEQPLLRGPLGVLWRGREVDTGTPATLLPVGPGAPAGLIEAWQARRERVDRFRHPAVLRDRGVGLMDGAPVLVSDPLDGVTVAAALDAAGPSGLPLVLACDLTRRAARALHAGWDRTPRRRRRPFGLLHGDLSPESVVIGADGEVRLLGFGQLPVGAGVARDPARAAGAPVWAAPEARAGAISHKGDVYALGAMFVHLLLGAAPGASPDLDRLRREVGARAQDPAAGDLLMSCLDPDPMGRIAASEVESYLEQLQRGRTEVPLSGFLAGALPRWRAVEAVRCAPPADSGWAPGADADSAAGALAADAAPAPRGAHAEGESETVAVVPLPRILVRELDGSSWSVADRSAALGEARSGPIRTVDAGGPIPVADGEPQVPAEAAGAPAEAAGAPAEAAGSPAEAAGAPAEAPAEAEAPAATRPPDPALDLPTEGGDGGPLGSQGLPVEIFRPRLDLSPAEVAAGRGRGADREGLELEGATEAITPASPAAGRAAEAASDAMAAVDYVSGDDGGALRPPLRLLRREGGAPPPGLFDDDRGAGDEAPARPSPARAASPTVPVVLGPAPEAPPAAAAPAQPALGSAAPAVTTLGPDPLTARLRDAARAPPPAEERTTAWLIGLAAAALLLVGVAAFNPLGGDRAPEPAAQARR